MARFPDRAAAGIELADAVSRLNLSNAVVLAIPKGGVPVAAAVAESLGAPLDLAEVHEVTGQRHDVGAGAVTTDAADPAAVHPSTAAAVGVSDDDVASERSRLEELIRRVRAVRPAMPLRARTVVVVDDGLLVTQGAVEAARRARAAGAARTVLAVPIAAPAIEEAAASAFDHVVCVQTGGARLDLADWYDDLPPVTDDEVVAAVTGRRAPHSQP